MLCRVTELPRIPGFVDAHCHAFQRALRGRTEGNDFWAWRDTMLELARGQTPGQVRTGYVDVYRELLGAGYTAVGEFHYLGLEEARAAAEAAEEAGIELVLLHVAYARGGLDRFRQASVAEYLREVEELRSDGIRVGVAPHSVRACPREWLEELGRYAAREELPLHVHADEQPREIEECLAEHGVRPIELLDRTVASASGPPSFTQRMPTAPSSICWRARVRVSAPARRQRPTSVTVSYPSSASARAASASASAPTRTSASIRSRNCESSRESRDVKPADEASSPRRRCSASAPTKVQAHSASRSGTTS